MPKNAWHTVQTVAHKPRAWEGRQVTKGVGCSAKQLDFHPTGSKESQNEQNGPAHTCREFQKTAQRRNEQKTWRMTTNCERRGNGSEKKLEAVGNSRAPCRGWRHVVT